MLIVGRYGWVDLSPEGDPKHLLNEQIAPP
jgi:hypothetical protein